MINYQLTRDTSTFKMINSPDSERRRTNSNILDIGYLEVGGTHRAKNNEWIREKEKKKKVLALQNPSFSKGIANTKKTKHNKN